MKRKMYVMLTQFPGIDAKALRYYTRFPYIHASIGLEEDMNTFYSFVIKGFIVEDIARYNKPGRDPFPCALYELEVSEEAYQKAKQMLQNFVANKNALRYSKWGLFLCLIGIPNHLRRQYFCSHFVAEILQRSKAAKLKKSSSLYLAKDLSRLKGVQLVFQGNLQRYCAQFQRVVRPTTAT